MTLLAVAISLCCFILMCSLVYMLSYCMYSCVHVRSSYDCMEFFWRDSKILIREKRVVTLE